VEEQEDDMQSERSSESNADAIASGVPKFSSTPQSRSILGEKTCSAEESEVESTTEDYFNGKIRESIGARGSVYDRRRSLYFSNRELLLFNTAETNAPVGPKRSKSPWLSW